MTDISEMTEQEKSVLLARAMGWDIGKHGCIFPPNEDISNYIDTGDNESLYDPANMALAWRVLNWALNYWFEIGEAEGLDIKFDVRDEYIEIMNAVQEHEPPADAQCLWLDKILELTIEAEIIDPIEEQS
jgi:hypothetical protein